MLKVKGRVGLESERERGKDEAPFTSLLAVLSCLSLRLTCLRFIAILQAE